MSHLSKGGASPNSWLCLMYHHDITKGAGGLPFIFRLSRSDSGTYEDRRQLYIFFFKSTLLTDIGQVYRV